jgi:hypothetical protein
MSTSRRGFFVALAGGAVAIPTAAFGASSVEIASASDYALMPMTLGAKKRLAKNLNWTRDEVARILARNYAVPIKYNRIGSSGIAK